MSACTAHFPLGISLVSKPGRVCCRGAFQGSARIGYRSVTRVRVSKHGGAVCEPKPDPFAVRIQHEDGWVDKLMIRLFAGKMAQQVPGLPVPDNPTYEDFVDVSRAIIQRKGSLEQQGVIARVLSSLLPPFAPQMFRLLFPFQQWSSELNAQITKYGFKWLVGPVQVQEAEVEFNGKKQIWRSGVKIEKCRYLETSGCVGMCTNLCKLPTQQFFCETFGIPLTMNPDFTDLSCTCVFGVTPPPIEEDEIYQQSCFSSQCSFATPEGPCPKIDTDRRQKAQQAADDETQ